MRMGVREICEVVFRAKSTQKLGSRTFYKNEPVLRFETLKTSSLEGAATTVYATGGRGNSRLLAWEGERTMTFVMEDALISAESFAILSGAGLVDAAANAPIYVHSSMKVEARAEDNGAIYLWDEDKAEPVWASWNKTMAESETKADATKFDIPVAGSRNHNAADIFCMVLDEHGEVSVEPCVPAEVQYTNRGTKIICDADGLVAAGENGIKPGDIVLVDFYVEHKSGAVQIDITPDKFGGYYYVEAATLFRRESDGKDLPAEFIIPKAKVQSNFTFSMAATGDPSTFSFTLDAFPDYIKFNRTKKVLAALQIVSSDSDEDDKVREACDGIDEDKWAATATTDEVP